MVTEKVNDEGGFKKKKGVTEIDRTLSKQIHVKQILGPETPKVGP